jgi:hypothetical protein
LAIALNVAHAAHADFSWELAAGIGEAEREGETAQFESQFESVTASHYFDPVDDQTGPRALAAFLDPASSLSLTVSEQTQDVVLAPVGTAPLLVPAGRDSTDYTVAGRYVLPRSQWYAGGRYSVGDADVPFESADMRGYGLLAGRYFNSGATRLELTLGRSRTEAEMTSEYCFVFAPCSRLTIRTEATADDVRAAVVHVGQLRSAAYSVFGSVGEIDPALALVAEVEAVSPPGLPVLPFRPIARSPSSFVVAVPVNSSLELDSLGTYSVGAEWFPTDSLGFRIDYERIEGPSDDTVLGVGASWFIGRHVGLQLTLSRDDPEGDIPRTDRAALRLIGRL